MRTATEYKIVVTGLIGVTTNIDSRIIYITIYGYNYNILKYAVVRTTVRY